MNDTQMKIIAKLTLNIICSLVCTYLFLMDMYVVRSTSEIIKIVGIANIWATFSGAVIFFYVALYYLNELMRIEPNLWDFNKVGLIVVIVIGPSMGLVHHKVALSNVENYVECAKERRASSRYSSRTYAVSEQLCLELNDK